MKKTGLIVFFLVLISAACMKQNIHVQDLSNGTQDPVEELLAKSGIKEMIGKIPDISKQSAIERLKSMGQSTDPDTLKRIDDILLKAIDPDEFYQSFYEQFKKDLTGSEVSNIIAWYDSPTGKRMLREELDSLNFEDMIKKNEFKNDIMNLQAPANRLNLIKRYMKATDAINRSVGRDLKITLLKAKGKSNNTSIPYEILVEDIKSNFEKNREKIEKLAEKEEFVDSLFHFRHISDSDFEAYVEFVETDAGKKYALLNDKIAFDRVFSIIETIETEFFGTQSINPTVINMEEYNFTFSVPESKWVKMDPSTINSDAKLCLVKRNPSLFFLIVPEIIGADAIFDVQSLTNLSQELIKSRAPDCVFTDTTKYSVNGIEGLRYNARASINNYDIYYCFCNLTKSGVAYQLILFGEERFKDEAISASDELFNGFHIIDETKLFYTEDTEPFEAYTSPYFDFSINLAGLNWNRYGDPKSIVSAAETGGLKRQNNFAIVPFHFNAENTPKHAVVAALLNELDISSDDKGIYNYKETSNDSVDTFSMNYDFESDGVNYTYALNILIKHDMAYFIVIWSVKGQDELNAIEHEILDHFTIGTVPGSRIDRSSMPEDINISQATLNYYLGSYLFDAKQYETALSYFQNAVELDPSKVLYLTYANICFARLGWFQEGQSYHDEHMNDYAITPDLLSWKAWFYMKTNQSDKSISLFREIFENGYRSDEDFIEYINLLGSLERWDDVDHACKAYLEKEPSTSVQLQYAYLLYDQKKCHESISLLHGLQGNAPLNPDISFALAENYSELGDYKEVISIADSLIEKNIYLADAYEIKGEAEYNLKWYQKSKHSFEQTLNYAPENANAKQYIQHISGLIGQGNNSMIKHEIQPVPIPEPLLNLREGISQMSSPDGYGAYYRHLIKGIHFEAGGDQRVTTYRKIKLTDKSGVSDFSTIEIDFDPLSESVFVNTLEIRDENGHVVAHGNTDDYFITDDKGSSMATHDKVLNIPIPQLKPGYEIELVSTTQYHSDSFAYCMHFLSASRPIEFSSVFVTGDTRFLTYKVSGTVKQSEIANGLAWWLTEPLVYQWEPYQASYDMFLPAVRLSDSRETWQQLGESYLNDIQDKLELDQDTCRLAEKLTKNAATKKEKIQSLTDYIQTEYVYKALEFGRRAIIPMSAGETIEKKYGDCKDHAVLLHQLLKALSIPSTLVLVNNYYSIDEDVPSLDQFNHMINYIPDGQTGWFIDTTAKNMDAMNLVPMGLADHKALMLQPGGIQFKTIPPYDAADSKLELNGSLSLGESDTLNVSEQIIFKGYLAAFMRDYLTSVDKNAYTQWVHELYSDTLSSCEAFSLDVENMSERNSDLIFQIHYNVSNINHQKKNLLSLQIPDVWAKYYLKVQPVIKRTTDFNKYYPFTVKKLVTLNLPPGYSVEADETGNVSEETEFGYVKSKISHGGSNTSIEFSCHSKNGSYKHESFQNFKLFFDRAIETASPEIQLKKL